MNKWENIAMSDKFLKQQWIDANKALTGYHVHIYFEKGDHHYSQAVAQVIEQQMLVLFPQHINTSSSVGVVGPHTKPNIVLEINKDAVTDIVPWLQFNNRGLSILIHPETGDEIRDHENAALWLNEPVALNEDFFLKLKQQNSQILKP
jgi:aromatic ring-cleaving dioxygenase